MTVGKTGVENSTIINAMVTYMLGVKIQDRIWDEIIDKKDKLIFRQMQSQDIMCLLMSLPS